MARRARILFDAAFEGFLDKKVLTLMSIFKNKFIKNKYARKKFYYIDAYVSLVNEIEEVTSRSRGMVMDEANKTKLGKRLYFHFYQRLHSYGGFRWDTNNFGTRPNQ